MLRSDHGARRPQAVLVRTPQLPQPPCLPARCIRPRPPEVATRRPGDGRLSRPKILLATAQAGRRRKDSENFTSTSWDGMAAVRPRPRCFVQWGTKSMSAPLPVMERVLGFCSLAPRLLSASETKSTPETKSYKILSLTLAHKMTQQC